LTEDQNAAVGEILADLARPAPMQRLLQGDVGCGKTAVAMFAVLAVVAAGRQAAIMAPTELLARQHAETLGAWLAESKVRWRLVTGSLPAPDRRAAAEELAAGACDVAIGTQALLDEKLAFARLGLVVIDEQHRFGVRQRATLKQAGEDPHYLVLTATPIPRTLALAAYGDFEVSSLRRPPPGRAPVRTYRATGDQEAKWWEFTARQLRAGRQAFIVGPVIDESGAAPGLEALAARLADGPLRGFRLELLHGRMTPEERSRVMDEFRSGRVQALVSTTIIEVGIDVPNATVITILDAARFGLAQLHQLRGRVTRGRHAGHCCLFGVGATDEAERRLDAFTTTTDGFALAEIDLALRGPGDLLGERQHGAPPLRVADLIRDAELLELARVDARRMIEADPRLDAPSRTRLRRSVTARYGAVWELGGVG
jgi:ATP-dependent DNA helicase RecG